MPLIQSLSYSNQNVATGKNVAFSAVARDYEMASFRIFLYELGGAPATLKSAVGTITKSGQVSSRFNIAPSVSTSVTSVALQSDYFVLANGDAVSVFVTSATAGDTTNVDIIAELWGVPDLSALITTVDTVVDALAVALADVPTVGEIDAQLSETHGAGTWGNGSGSISTTVTVNDGVNPIDGVDVWVSTDSAGTNVIARGSTGALGTVVFMLDAGTYYAWKQLAGYDFTNPQSFTVS